MSCPALRSVEARRASARSSTDTARLPTATVTCTESTRALPFRPFCDAESERAVFPRKPVLEVHPPEREHPLDAGAREFAADFGQDALSWSELDAQIDGPYGDHLAPLGHEVHLDALPFAVVEGKMIEGALVEVCVELAREHAQHVLVERGRDPLRIVVCRVKDTLVFDEVDAKEESVPL